MQPIILIPARLQSTRLPEKPLADIHGKPMIQHMVERARVANAGRVVVATDSEKIADIVKKAGGEAVMTSPDCPSGSDRIWQALQVIDPIGMHDVIINLQGDMPTFSAEILSQVLAPLDDEGVDIATLAAPIHTEEEKQNPAVVKAIFNHVIPAPRHPDHARVEGSPNRMAQDSSTAALCVSARNDKCFVNSNSYQATTFTREPRPSEDGNFYHHVGIYAYRREALKKFVSLPPSENERREKLEQLRALDAGMTIGVCIIDEAPIGVDTPETLEMARQKLLS